MALVRVVILCHWRVSVLALHIHLDKFEFSCELIGQTHHITGPAVMNTALSVDVATIAFSVEVQAGSSGYQCSGVSNACHWKFPEPQAIIPARVAFA